MPQTRDEMIAADPSVWVEIDGEMVPNYDATITEFAALARAQFQARIVSST